jgi:hypothetical protein
MAKVVGCITVAKAALLIFALFCRLLYNTNRIIRLRVVRLRFDILSNLFTSP